MPSITSSSGRPGRMGPTWPPSTATTRSIRWACGKRGPCPNSDLVMATAAAHHAMTAGSIILLDVSKGIDGLDPIHATHVRRVVSGERISGAALACAGRRVRAAAGPGRGTALAGTLLPHTLSAVGRLLPGSLQLRRAGRRAQCQQGQHVRHLPGGPIREPGACSIGTSTSPVSGRRRCGRVCGRLCCRATLEPSCRLQAKARSSCRTSTTAGRNFPPGEENRITQLRIVQVLLKTTPQRQFTPRRFCECVAGQTSAGHGAGRTGWLGLLPRSGTHSARLPGAGSAWHGGPDHALAHLPAAGRAHQLCGLPRASVQHAGSDVRRRWRGNGRPSPSRPGRTDPSR